MGYIGQPMKTIVESFDRTLEVVKRPRKWFRVPDDVVDMNQYLQERGIDTSGGFNILPRRWVVERYCLDQSLSTHVSIFVLQAKQWCMQQW